MKKMRLIVGLVVVIGAAVGLVVWLSLPNGEAAGQEAQLPSMGVRVKVAKDRPNRAEKRIDLGKRGRLAPGKQEASSEKDKPDLELTDEEEAQLNEEQRATLAEIRKALDSEDLRSLRKAIGALRAKAMAQARQEGHRDWTRFAPRALRAAAVESLGWFGADALADLVEFTADADSDVMRSALDSFEQAMADPSFGDKDRAAVIQSLASVITDEDAVDWMCMEINNMRHSVAVETLQVMAEKGTDMVKSKVPETVEFYTGEDEITTQQLKNWLTENPDDPDDDDFYGPMDTNQ